MTNNSNIGDSQILIYQTSDGDIKIDVRLEEETVWLTIDQMSMLFGKSRATINEHIINIFKEEEFEERKVMRKIGNSDFSTKPTNFYNLDVIISVGYRVKSPQTNNFASAIHSILNNDTMRKICRENEELSEKTGTS